jgi:gamma-glutamyltranspeptidase/glutathione hydrolase
MVVAARAEAARAGVAMLAAGGTAADAAAAAGLALAVIDPANCGLGGHGGFAVVAPDPTTLPSQVEFNTALPAALDEAALARAPRDGIGARGGATVSRPSVLPGLYLLHQRFGRLPWADVVAPAIALAREGFIVGPDLADVLGKVLTPKARFAPAFLRMFSPNGRPLAATDRLVQSALGDTLATVAREGARSLRAGPIVDRLVAAVRADGGALAAGDFADDDIVVAPASRFRFAHATVHGPRPERSGFGIIVRALEAAGADPWPKTRDAAYIARVADALRVAWAERDARFLPVLIAAAKSTQHTTHLCAADAGGGLVSLTFTHGPLWFGSGLLEEKTGILLNCGASLLVRDAVTQDRLALPFIAPMIARADDGRRFALGTPGGRRIPATLVTALIDTLAAGATLAEAIARPRIATAPSGALEVEAGLQALAPEAKAISPKGYFGPSSGIEFGRDGIAAVAALDPRFSGAAATEEDSCRK